MVKPLQRAEVKTFSGGLVTDAPTLEFPGNASVDECNFENNYDGSRSRRKGVKVLDGAFISGDSSQSPSIYGGGRLFIWEAPGGDVSLNLLVIQTGNTISFYDATAEKPLQNPVQSFLVGGWLDSSFSSVSGYLIQVFGQVVYNLFTYNPETKTISLDYLQTFKIRDVFGIEDKTNPYNESDPTHRGSPLTPEHYYNLYNQGWAIPRLPWKYGEHPLEDAVAMASAPSPRNPGSRTPSSADTVWQGMDVRNIGREKVSDTGETDAWVYTSAEAFNQAQYLTSMTTGTSAAKGFFIINPFQRGISRAAAWSRHKFFYPETGNKVVVDIDTFPPDITANGPTCVASHAGRAFYSGIKGGAPIDGDKRSPNWSSTVFFSQVIQRKEDFSKCYQEGDPTSREGSDVVDTDGGFINVSGATNIQQLVSFGKYLLVLAENGVWTISGDTGFTATSFKVNAVSTFGCCNKDGVISIGGAIYFLGTNAVYRAGLNQFGDIEIVDITTQTLSKFYRSFPQEVLQSARSSIDLVRNTVHWMMYSSPTNPEFVWNLQLDVVRGCLTPMKIALPFGQDLQFLGLYQVPGYAVQSTGLVPVGGKAKPGDWRMYWIQGTYPTQRYLQTEYGDENFRDWAGVYTPEGADAEAYLETGATTAGDVAVKKQIPYLTMVFRNKEKGNIVPHTSSESSCLGRVKWDFSDKITANRWGRELQLYRLSRPYMDENGFIDNGQTMTITKSKLRGHGKSFSLRLETEPKKDCHIIGWSLTLTGNGVT